MDRVRRTWQDVRALGAGAPMRAGVEASKRFGGHAVVFGRLIRTVDAPPGTSPFPTLSVPASVRMRTLAESDRIAEGDVTVFSRQIDVGPDPDWHAVIDGPGSWPDSPWWEIDIRSEARLGDVKWAWELGRHRHLVMLARAVHLGSDNDQHADVLNHQLRAWLAQNPPEVGVHWYSNLELSLRAVAWLQILALAPAELHEDVARGMWRHLYHTGRHLVADLPYTYSTMRNNHLLGDALGMLVLGTAFAGDERADRWLSIGTSMFDAQVERLVRFDGAMTEDSVSYHRFVMEMLATRLVVGPPSEVISERLGAAAGFLTELGALEGPVPQYGDWDEGRVLVGTAGATDLTGSVRLASSLAGTGAPEAWRSEFDEVAWYAQRGTPADPPAPSSIVADRFARATVGSWSVWLKGSSGASHGHADLGSITIQYDGATLTGDPGTGTYNGPLAIRNGFRSSAGHNVLRVEGADQYGPHRAFRWERKPPGVLGRVLASDHTAVLWALHAAFAPRRVVRLVVMGHDAVAVADVVTGEATNAHLTIPLAPTVTYDEDLRTVLGAISVDGPGGLAPTRGSDHPFRGWWSPTYGAIEPSTWLTCTSIDTGADLDDADSAVWGFGTSRNAVRSLIRSVHPEIRWTHDEVTLGVDVDGHRHSETMRL